MANGVSNKLSALKAGSVSAIGVFGSCLLFTILLAIIAGVPIAMVVIGSKNYDECPTEPWIPKYLIVAGSVTVGTILLTVMLQLCGLFSDEDGGCIIGFLSCLITLATLFTFAWFICGSVWIFSIYEPEYDKTKHPDDYCDELTYKFSFWLLIVTYTSPVFCCVISCICGMLTAMCQQ